MKLDISARMTSQVSTINYYNMKKILLKKKKERKKGNISKYGELGQNSHIKNLRKTILR